MTCFNRPGFHAALLLAALPSLAAAQASGVPPTAVLPVQDAYPHVSRQGLVVFQSNRVGGWKPFVARLDGSGLRQLTSHERRRRGRDAGLVARRIAGGVLLQSWRQ